MSRLGNNRGHKQPKIVNIYMQLINSDIQDVNKQNKIKITFNPHLFCILSRIRRETKSIITCYEYTVNQSLHTGRSHNIRI